MFDYYCNLPDYLPVDEVKKHFQTLLDDFENRRSDLKDFIKSLSELSVRQWHTYTLLESGLRTKIDTIMLTILPKKDFQQIDLLVFRNGLSTIGNLGLAKSYNFLRTSVFQSVDSEKKHEIQRLVNQIEKFRNGNIENPFSDLEKK